VIDLDIIQEIVQPLETPLQFPRIPLQAVDQVVLEIAWRASEPEVVISDRAKNIIGDEFFTFLQKRRVRLSPTMSYHHQANPVERYVKTLKPVLESKIVVNHMFGILNGRGQKRFMWKIYDCGLLQPSHRMG
jgi:hypothetical protein